MDSPAIASGAENSGRDKTAVKNSIRAVAKGGLSATASINDQMFPAIETANSLREAAQRVPPAAQSSTATTSSSGSTTVTHSSTRELFKDKSSSAGLDGDLAIKQGEVGNCHVAAVVFGCSTTTNGDNLLERMIKPKKEKEGGKALFEVTFGNGESATVTEKDLKEPKLSTSPRGVRIIEVAEAKAAQARSSHPSPNWIDHADSGNFLANTMKRFTGNDPRSVEFTRVPDLDRIDYVKDVAKSFATNRENVLVLGCMVKESIFETRGIKTTDIEVASRGHDRRYTVTLPDGNSATFTTKDLMAHHLPKEPSTSQLIELTKGVSASGELSKYKSSDLSGWSAPEVMQILPCGLPYVTGHAHSIVGVNLEKETFQVVNPWDTTRAKDVPFKEFGDTFHSLEWVPVTPKTDGCTMFPNEYRWLDAHGKKPVFSKVE